MAPFPADRSTGAPSAQSGRVQHLTKVAGELPVGGGGDARTGHDDQVEALGELPALQPERLPEQPLGPVARDRSPDLPAHDQAGPGRAGAGGPLRYIEHHGTLRVRAPGREDRPEGGRGTQPVHRRHDLTPAVAHAGTVTEAPQAPSRVRPLARRRAMIERPARVRIRIRKPCVLARLRLFGWKVRFTTTAPNPVEAEGRQRQGAENAPKDDGTGHPRTSSTRPRRPPAREPRSGP